MNQFPCLSRYTRIYTCLPHSLRCDGSIDCQVTGGGQVTDPLASVSQSHLCSLLLSVQDLGDEIDCDVPTCGEWLRNFYGSFSSPNYPDFYPPGSNCTWLIDTGDHRKVTSEHGALKKKKVPGADSASAFSSRLSSGSQTSNWTGQVTATMSKCTTVWTRILAACSAS